MAKPLSTTTIATLKGMLPTISPSRRMILLTGLALLVGVAGVLVYFLSAHRAAIAAEAPASQSATVRQGELVLSTSGTGLLVPASEIDLGFSASGQVTGVYVKPGDYVEAGILLAEVDSMEAGNKYKQAKLAYQELTSATAIATAQEQAVQA